MAFQSLGVPALLLTCSQSKLLWPGYCLPQMLEKIGAIKASGTWYDEDIRYPFLAWKPIAGAQPAAG
jgi:hypothetical protein